MKGRAGARALHRGRLRQPPHMAGSALAGGKTKIPRGLRRRKARMAGMRSRAEKIADAEDALGDTTTF